MGRAHTGVVQLLRLATIRLAGPPPRVFDSLPYLASNGVEVRPDSVDGLPSDPPGDLEGVPSGGLIVTWPREDQRVRLVVFATVDAGAPSLTGDRLDVPDEPRRRAEAAIGEYADLLAIIHQCKRSIRSPRPSLALAPASHDELLRLEDVPGLSQRSAGSAAVRVIPLISTEAGSQILADRLDGVGLLADALSEDTAIGRVRELFRFFERAFRLPPPKCISPVATFLQSNPRHKDLGFTGKEVSYWFETLRAEVTHADWRPSYLRSADLEPYLGRLELAAYDVLFNKSIWRHPSATRQSRMDFMSGISPQGTSVVVFQPTATLLVAWMDPYNVYPVDHEATVTLPQPWIWRLPGQEEAGSS